MIKWITLKTKAFRLIFNLLEKAHLNSSMHVLIAPTGCGKTFTINYYRKTHPNVYYLKIDKIYSPKEFYLEILNILGVYDYDRRVPLKSIADRVSFLLNEKRVKTLLIFDEIGKFSSEMIEYLQSIRDSTDEHVGIVLAGTGKFEKDFNGWVSKNYRSIPELNSRIFSWEYAFAPTDPKKYAIVKKNGVTEPIEIKRIVKDSKDLRKLYQNVMEYRYKKSSQQESEDVEAEKMEAV